MVVVVVVVVSDIYVVSALLLLAVVAVGVGLSSLVPGTVAGAASAIVATAWLPGVLVGVDVFEQGAATYCCRHLRIGVDVF